MTKYERWYFHLCERARGRKLDCYCERHHIQPRSLGGDNESSNLVDLTYREHFLAHWLLTKIYTGRGRRSMLYALMLMGTKADNSQRIVAGWQFETAKRAVRDHWLELRNKKIDLQKIQTEAQLRQLGLEVLGQRVVRRKGRRVHKPQYEVVSMLRSRGDLKKAADILLKQ